MGLEIDTIDPQLRRFLEALAKRSGVDLDDLPAGLEPLDLIRPADVRQQPKELVLLIERARRGLTGPVPKAELIAAGCYVPEREELADPIIPPGAAPPGFLDGLPSYANDGDEIAAGGKRPPGKPRKGVPAVPWELIEHVLVFGEIYQVEGRSLVRYPTPGELAKRFGVDRKQIQKRAKLLKLDEARARVKDRVDREVENVVVSEHAAALVVGRERVNAICDSIIAKFEAMLKADKIRVDSIADLNTVVRLKEFINGGADSRQQTDHTISLETLMGLHKADRGGRVIDVTPDPAETLGVVEERLIQTAGGQWQILPPEGEETTAALPMDPKPESSDARAPKARLNDGVLHLEDEDDEGPDEDPDDIHTGYIETHPVTSTNLAEIGYDDDRGIMEIVFHNGGLYRYRVPRETFDLLDRSESPGKVFAALKGSLVGVRVES